jgi:hypothetical protein
MTIPMMNDPTRVLTFLLFIVNYVNLGFHRKYWFCINRIRTGQAPKHGNEMIPQILKRILFDKYNVQNRLKTCPSSLISFKEICNYLNY